MKKINQHSTVRNISNGFHLVSGIHIFIKTYKNHFGKK